MKQWLKCDFHLHTDKDLRDYQDNTRVEYSPEQLIDYMSENGFDVLAITHHDARYYPDTLIEYAKSKGILLIPGIERTIANQHVVILNVDNHLPHITSLEDIASLSKKHLVFAPHPFYKIASSLEENLEKNIDLFDAIEYSSMYTSFYNIFNMKARTIARRYNKPMIGTSDAHHYFQLGKTYSLVYAEKNTSSIINAIKKGDVRIKTEPLPFLPILYITLKILLFKGLNAIRKLFS
jgi:predicted metal-dependent phosphoesterase TrpH